MNRPAWKPNAYEQLYGKRGKQQRQQTPLQQFVRSRVMAHTYSKVMINEETAMQIAAVFCAVRIRSGLMSTLPIKVYQKNASGKDGEVTQHPLSDLLGVSPNPYQTIATFKEQAEAHSSLWGNSYAELELDDLGEVSSAVMRHPGGVEPYIDERDRDARGWPRLKYHLHSSAGGRIVDASQMVHIPGLGFDGLQGFSVLTMGAESFGIAKSGDKLAAQFNGTAGKPFLIVSTPEYLDEDRYDNLSREINNDYNEDNAFGSMLLEGGATASFPAVPLRDAQFLESRKFQGEEISARWFGLPPHLAGYLDRAHFDNVEEQDRALLVFTLAPQLVRSEEEWNRKGFTQADRNRGLYVKYNVDALLRGQQKERYEAHKSAIHAGWKTINEVRATEDLPPLPGGDELPRPAALWGSDKPEGTAPSDQGQKSKRAADGRLQGLTVDILQSLQQAERFHAERHIGKPDFGQRMREFYDSHERRMFEKLKPLGADALLILDHCRSHRDALIELKTAEDVHICCDGWTDHPQQLAEQLI